MLENRYSDQRVKLTAYVALTLALCAIVVSILSLRTHSYPSGSASAETSLMRMKRTGIMRVGYGGFPPYTIVDPRESDPNKRVTGFTVDMVNELASRFSPALKVQWYNLDWDTFAADMYAGKFDFVGDAVYETVPKASDFSMTEPFSYFGLAVGLVRVSENRFTKFEDLDRPDITIALAQGYVSTEYAERYLSKPHFQLIPVGKDAFNQLDQVLLGKADVALQDVPTVVQYVRAHPGKVKALWLDHPPSIVPGGFVTRNSDQDLLNFLNVGIRILSADGTLSRLDQKWKSLGYYERPILIPGAGLGIGQVK